MSIQDQEPMWSQPSFGAETLPPIAFTGTIFQNEASTSAAEVFIGDGDAGLQPSENDIELADFDDSWDVKDGIGMYRAGTDIFLAQGHNSFVQKTILFLSGDTEVFQKAAEIDARRRQVDRHAERFVGRFSIRSSIVGGEIAAGAVSGTWLSAGNVWLSAVGGMMGFISGAISSHSVTRRGWDKVEKPLKHAREELKKIIANSPATWVIPSEGSFTEGLDEQVKILMEKSDNRAQELSKISPYLRKLTFAKKEVQKIDDRLTTIHEKITLLEKSKIAFSSLEKEVKELETARREIAVPALECKEQLRMRVQFKKNVDRYQLKMLFLEQLCITSPPSVKADLADLTDALNRTHTAENTGIIGEVFSDLETVLKALQAESDKTNQLRLMHEGYDSIVEKCAKKGVRLPIFNDIQR